MAISLMLPCLQFPPSIHLCVTLAHTKPGVAETFLKDLRAVAEPLVATPKVKVAALPMVLEASAHLMPVVSRRKAELQCMEWPSPSPIAPSLKTWSSRIWTPLTRYMQLGSRF
jgi:hypothetical protein